MICQYCKSKTRELLPEVTLVIKGKRQYHCPRCFSQYIVYPGGTAAGNDVVFVVPPSRDVSATSDAGVVYND